MTKSYMPEADPELLLRPFFNEEVARETLDNGFVTVVKPDNSSALVSVQVWVKTGSIHEGGCLGSGLSHYLEHMLFKGTRKRLGPRIAADVQKHGGSMNAYTTFDRTVYYIEIPSEHVEVALDVLADAVFDSVLPEEEVDRERDVILREIDMGLDDPDTVLTQTLFSTAFREHPYRHPVIGYRDVFESLDRDDLIAYYRSRYVPNNATLILAGDVDPEAAGEKIRKYFGAFPRRRVSPNSPPYEPDQQARRDVRLYRDVQLSRCSLAYKIPGLAHEDAPGLDILAAVLGNGNSSILWKRLRDERRLVHDIEAMTWKPAGGGLLGISFSADPEKREAAQAAVSEVVGEAIAEGFSDRLVTKALRQAMVSEINVRKTVGGQAARLGAAEVAAGDLGFSAAYFRRLSGVGADQLARLGRKYLREDRLTAVSLDPMNARPAGRGARTGGGKTVSFEERTLANGARLLFHHDDRLPEVHVRLICLGGGQYENPARRGVTSLLATLLTRDTEKRSAADVSEAIESLGGRFSEFSGNNTFGISLETLPADFDAARDLLEQAVRYPAFREATFQREKDALLAGLKEDLDEILYFGVKRLRARFFGEHPLGVDDSGTLETIPAIGLGDVVDQYRRLVVSGNLVLSAAGDLETAGAIPKLEAFLESFPSVSFERREHRFAGPSEPGEFRETLPRQQAVVLQAYPDCGIVEPSFPVGEVVDELLSGMSSRLFERVREELGLAYFVGSGRVSGIREGMFYLYAGTHPDAAGEVVREMDDELLRIREGGVTEEELNRCQVRLKAGRRSHMQANGTRAMLAGLNAAYGLPVNDWLNFDEKIDAVTREAVTEFARDRFRDDRKVALTVGPGKS